MTYIWCDFCRKGFTGNTDYSVQCPYCGTYLSYTVNREDDCNESENYEEDDFNNEEDA